MHDLINPHHHFKNQYLRAFHLRFFLLTHGSSSVLECSKGCCGYLKWIPQTLSQEQEVDVLCLCIPSVSQWFSLVVQRLCHQTRHNKLDSRIKSDTYDGSKHPWIRIPSYESLSRFSTICGVFIHIFRSLLHHQPFICSSHRPCFSSYS